MSQYNQFNQNAIPPNNMPNMPPLQTQNHQMHGQQQPGYSPQSYQQSPGAMSPTGGPVAAGSLHPAKRQRLSPGPAPASPSYSPYSASPYTNSPYAMSPPAQNYLPRPESPAMPSFHQPQPYQYTNNMDQRPMPQGSLMPPPKVPYSKTQDNAELEKANPRDMDVNNISDVLTGSGIDLRAEEEAMFSNVGSHNSYGASFNSQSTLSNHGSFNQWGQQVANGAFQGTGPLSQSFTEEQQHEELMRKHREVARILNEAAEKPLHDPFIQANSLRTRMAKRAYEQGISLNLEGLFDKIPETPREVTRTTMTASNGESIVALQANSILNHGAPLVELLSLLSLAAEKRVRTIVEDAFALSQGRQTTSNGMVPPGLADIAVANGEMVSTTVAPVNVSKTEWEGEVPVPAVQVKEGPDNGVSPLTSTASKHLPNATRLLTPPKDPQPKDSQLKERPKTPEPTIQVKTNHVTACLKRKMEEDERFEKLRIEKRRKRQQGNSANAADVPFIPPVPLPEKLSKKERDREKKMSQTDDVLHSKANETANLAFGKKKKYSWMTGGQPSGATTPAARLNVPVGMSSGTATPAAATAAAVDRNLLARKRQFMGGDIEVSDMGKSIQLRDLVHVLEHDGRDRKTLAHIMGRMRSDKEDTKRKRPDTVPPAR